MYADFLLNRSFVFGDMTLRILQKKFIILVLAPSVSDHNCGSTSLDMSGI